MRALTVSGVFACLTCSVACGGGGAQLDARYPPREAGCDVKVVEEAPSTPTDNIGPVSAKCDETIPDDECMRQLKDEVCKLGGDLAWGVSPKPDIKSGKKYFYGRAAHSKKR